MATHIRATPLNLEPNVMVALALAFCLCLGSNAGCSGDEESAPDSVDSVVELDAFGPDATSDSGAPDGARPDALPSSGDLRCGEIRECIAQCKSDQSCKDNCKILGTLDAQRLYQAALDCYDAAGQGACRSDCTDSESNACIRCTNLSCAAASLTCWEHDEPTTAGFGDTCTSTCPTGLTCIIEPGAETGFCTKSCDNPGGICKGEPKGTSAFCLLPGANTHYCAFICKTKLNEYACPTALQCSPTRVSGLNPCTP